ncbi:MAG: chorismate mutase [Clostridia bacterium]|nr:chorismate mutase [Clostridia bacterium]
MKLDELRTKIDDVDERICALLKERFDLVKEVGEAKKELGANVENKDREREVIERVRNAMPDELKDYAEDVFRLLIEDSKDLQKKL